MAYEDWDEREFFGRSSNACAVWYGVRQFWCEHDFGCADPICTAPKKDHVAVERTVKADEPAFTGFVFKIQANMDPKHRDRVAFMRVCSGKYERGMKMNHVRLGKEGASVGRSHVFGRRP